MPRHLPRSIPRRFQELLVEQPHQRQVLRRLRYRRAVKRGAADRYQCALPYDRQARVPGLDHRPPPVHAHRPKAFAKKSRSTTSWPILACSFSTSPSRATSFASTLPENTDDSPSTAWRFHSLIIVWCTPCFVASCAVVSSPRSASRATFALNSAEYLFRLPVIGSVLQPGRTKLKHLSDFPGPPHPFDVMLSEHRDLAAAKAFFRSAKAVTGVTPDRVTTDGHDAYPRAIRTELGRHGRHRTNRYLNNRLEQDHRGIKGRCRPMLGLKSTASAARCCRCHDELRNFLRCRSRMRQRVPAATRRWQHMRRAAIALGILETA